MKKIITIIICAVIAALLLLAISRKQADNAINKKESIGLVNNNSDISINVNNAKLDCCQTNNYNNVISQSNGMSLDLQTNSPFGAHVEPVFARNPQNLLDRKQASLANNNETAMMISAHDSLRINEVANPDSKANKVIMQEMIFKALSKNK
jgi:hypothetical protein